MLGQGPSGEWVSDREQAIEHLQYNGRHLKYVNDELKKDEQVVLTAIGSDASAFNYADESLKKEESFLLSALLYNSETFEYL